MFKYSCHEEVSDVAACGRLGAIHIWRPQNIADFQTPPYVRIFSKFILHRGLNYIENQFTPRKVSFDVNKRYERKTTKLIGFYLNTLYMQAFQMKFIIFVVLKFHFTCVHSRSILCQVLSHVSA